MRSALRPLDTFQPAVTGWFRQRFPPPTAARIVARPMIGTVPVGDEVPARAGSRVLDRDGESSAALIDGNAPPLIELSAAEMRPAKHAPLHHAPAPTALRATTAR